MRPNNFSRLLRFAQKTGDRLIVTDPEGREPMVILPFEQYEHLTLGAFGPGFWEEGDEVMRDEEMGEEEGEAIELGGVEEETMEDADGPASVLEVFPSKSAEDPRLNPATSVPVSTPVQNTQKSQKNDGFGEERFYLEPL